MLSPKVTEPSEFKTLSPLSGKHRTIQFLSLGELCEIIKELELAVGCSEGVK